MRLEQLDSLKELLEKLEKISGAKDKKAIAAVKKQVKRETEQMVKSQIL